MTGKTPDESIEISMDSLPRASIGPQAPLSAWWSLRLPGGGIHMKVEDSGPDGRWVVTDVYVHAPEISTTMLREVPIGQLNLTLNFLNNLDGWSPLDALEAIGDEFGQQVIVDPEQDPDLPTFRQLAEHAPSELSTPRMESRPRLTRPDGKNPDGFYALVAAAYREYALQTRAPAIEIAKEADVPVPTARSWVREARRRGKLPTGTRGKAG